MKKKYVKPEITAESFAVEDCIMRARKVESNVAECEEDCAQDVSTAYNPE